MKTRPFCYFKILISILGISLVGLQADVRSLSGSISFEANGNSSSEMILNANGLGVFVSNPTQKLEVCGNSLITGTVGVGGSAGSSNLNVHGTLGFTPTTISNNSTLDKSMYFCDNSSSNLTLTLPAAGLVSGRTIWIKNLAQGETAICGNIEGRDPLVLGTHTSQLSSVQLLSDGAQWHILSSMGNISGYKPSSTSNLVLWFDAQNTNSITATGGNVSQWRDQSGHNNHLNEASLYPTFPGNTINGKSTIAFRYKRMVASTLPNDARLTIFMVVQFSNNPTNIHNLISTREASSHGFTWDTQSARLYMRSYSPSSDVQFAGPLNSNTPYIMAGIYDSALISNYCNGFLNTGNGNMIPSTVTPFTVGYKTGDSGGNHLYGDVGEIIVYNKAFNRSEVAQVFAYLKAKWGVSF
jgi:hypothetical protein